MDINRVDDNVFVVTGNDTKSRNVIVEVVSIDPMTESTVRTIERISINEIQTKSVFMTEGLELYIADDLKPGVVVLDVCSC